MFLINFYLKQNYNQVVINQDIIFLQNRINLMYRNRIDSNLLHNRIDKKILQEQLKNESFKRRTLSFYRYITLPDPFGFRNDIYKEWNELNCFGRIYVATEGINAQMSVPEHNLQEFLYKLLLHPELHDIPVKYAIEDDGKSFYKLIVKVRTNIVADGLDKDSYDMERVGDHLTPVQFHKALEEQNSIVIDMRNHYESEIGRFENAYCPEVRTFREAVQLVADKFSENKNKQILLYCTGGIRCEKASSYLIHNGFENVAQLNGGIINYASEIKQYGLSSKFIGKNFVFDSRLKESIDDSVIAKCHQCGKPADNHVNCANNFCHILFIQCPECNTKYYGCCSADCLEVNALPESERIKLPKNTKKAARTRMNVFNH